MKVMMQTLGQKIRELREEKGWTQPQLASFVGVSNGDISFWENDVNEPTASHIVKLCEAFEISADYLLNLSQN